MPDVRTNRRASVSKLCVLVADSAVARIFTARGPDGPLNEVESLSHTASRLHERDLASDRPGRTFDSVGGGRHAKELEVSPKEEEAVRFAEQLAERMHAGRTAGEFDRLMVVAAPRFLGLLREKLDPATRALVGFELDKDLTRHIPEEIRSHLPGKLYPED
jgi:protein required for attachment to host cells